MRVQVPTQKLLAFQKYIRNNCGAIFLGLVVGTIIGFWVHAPNNGAIVQLQSKPLRSPDPEYPLTNPLLGYDNPESTNFGQLVNFKSKLSKLVDQETVQNNASKISIYFRDMNTGHWISINEDEPYTPASLLKLPIMMAYYRLAETDPKILNKEIGFYVKNNLVYKQFINPAQRLQVGKSYTIDELIKNMIIYSDNDSMQLLFDNFTPNVLSKVFSDMGIFMPTNLGVEDFLSVKNYALFLRVLYGSTYLNSSYSEKALELLSKSEFKNGLVSGVPEGVTVAHKFGESGLVDLTTNIIKNREFHDCGIVYYPQKPYLLCVMTKGNDLNNLEKSVSNISKFVYDEVKNYQSK
ncbi:MAG: class A beta-lactamase-related serine hydrolase [Candidatus Pacebacteria bacterium]|nr:class A beta-lactamase-related serine hydrolase [Candidatus Paceibacterota bacterium]